MRRNGGYEPMVQAFSGLFPVNGYPDRPGVRIGTSVLDLGSAVWAALGCIAGLLQREKTGQGCVVDASLYETALGLLTVHFARFQAGGTLPERHPSGSLAVVLFQAFDTADGQVIVAAANDRLFVKLPGRARPSRVGQGPALQDQCRPFRQQGRIDPRGDRGRTPAPERGVGCAPGAGRRALRAHQRHDPHQDASADRCARHGATGA